MPRRNEAFPVKNKALPRRNETFPVENRTFPTENEAFLTENETFPVENDAFLIGNKTFSGGNKAFTVESETFEVGQGIGTKGKRGKGAAKQLWSSSPVAKSWNTASSRSIKPVTANPVTQLWWCCKKYERRKAQMRKVSAPLVFFTVSAKNRVALLQIERGNLCSMTR